MDFSDLGKRCVDCGKLLQAAHTLYCRACFPKDVTKEEAHPVRYAAHIEQHGYVHTLQEGGGQVMPDILPPEFNDPNYSRDVETADEDERADREWLVQSNPDQLNNTEDD